MAVSNVHVLRLEMVNLTVGHLRFLHDLESPYVTTDNGAPDTSDLILAAFVCSMRWQDARKHIGRWYLKPVIKFWGRRCAKKCNLIYEGSRFSHYLGTSMEARKIKKANGGKSLFSPLHNRLYLMLVEELNHDPDKAWDINVRDAVDLWMARAEKQGALEFWSEKDLAHWEWHKEKEKEWLSQQEARVE